MLRLHRDSSRSYPGRPARLGVVFCDSARHGDTECDRAGVSRGHTRREETSPVKWKSRERLTPPKGQTQRREEHL
jgi:hypothetical protein